jgi:hypothetical protein
MKKKEKLPIDSEMQELLDENNYTPLEEWKANGAIPNTDNSNKNRVEGAC